MKRAQQSFGLNGLVLGISLLAHLSASPARADAGPKPVNDVVVHVTYLGKPLSDSHFEATLLELVGPTSVRGGGRTRSTMDLAKMPLSEADGRQWKAALYEWGGQGKNGEVRFQGFHPPDRREPGGGWPPRHVRLVIYLPSEEKLFLTDVAETRPYLTFLKADLQPDGTGSLRTSWESLGQRMGLPYALGLTLLVELAVVIAYGRYQGIALTRLLVLCVVVNVISLPVVWFVTVACYSEFGELRGFGCLLLAELGATAFEGLAYSWVGRLGIRGGFGVALMANVASMAVGLLA